PVLTTPPSGFSGFLRKLASWLGVGGSPAPEPAPVVVPEKPAGRQDSRRGRNGERSENRQRRNRRTEEGNGRERTARTERSERSENGDRVVAPMAREERPQRPERNRRYENEPIHLDSETAADTAAAPATSSAEGETRTGRSRRGRRGG